MILIVMHERKICSIVSLIIFDIFIFVIRLDDGKSSKTIVSFGKIYISPIREKIRRM